MPKTVKSYIYKGNIFNFIVLLFSSLCFAAGMIFISLMLEKIIAIATAKNMDELIQQGIYFLILLAGFILVYLVVIYLKPKYKKKAITQYKNNIYEHLLSKNITNFNLECFHYFTHFLHYLNLCIM